VSSGIAVVKVNAGSVVCDTRGGPTKGAQSERYCGSAWRAVPDPYDLPLWARIGSVWMIQALHRKEPHIRPEILIFGGRCTAVLLEVSLIM
jgi:hypothetical protein